MAKPFLILQLRPEDAAADDELAAFMRFGGLRPTDVQRVRMEQADVPKVDLSQYSGVIIGGGPSCVSDPLEKKPSAQKRFEQQLAPLIDDIIARDFPFLGACYGLGYLINHLGGSVGKGKYSEGVGAVDITLTDEAAHDPLTTGIGKRFRAFGGHKESVQILPDEVMLLASSETCPVHLVRYKQNIYAAQFHTELDVNGIIVRIRTYKHAGYFPPEDADALIADAQKEAITEPGKIFKNFIERYRQN